MYSINNKTKNAKKQLSNPGRFWRITSFGAPPWASPWHHRDLTVPYKSGAHGSPHGGHFALQRPRYKGRLKGERTPIRQNNNLSDMTSNAHIVPKEQRNIKFEVYANVSRFPQKPPHKSQKNIKKSSVVYPQNQNDCRKIIKIKKKSKKNRKSWLI